MKTGKINGAMTVTHLELASLYLRTLMKSSQANIKTGRNAFTNRSFEGSTSLVLNVIYIQSRVHWLNCKATAAYSLALM